MEWLKILLLVAAAAAAVYATISQFWPQLITLPARDMQGSTAVLRDALLRLSTYIIGTALILAIGDYFLKRWQFEKSIMMTKEEVKEDLKAMDGNPIVKGRVRAIQREQAKRRMMARIKDADVIITNPTHYAVALEYKPATMAAPKLVAKGADLIAQTIKEMGRKFDIPTVENVPLARALYRSVDLEQEIPLELYKAVAEVLAFVFKARNRL
jgi:flagellar biosynthesis protein FlhB